MRTYRKAWEEITHDPFILSSITGYEIPFIETPWQPAPPPDPKFSPQELEDCRMAIETLLIKGAISKCESTQGEFVSTYFLRKKPSGESRFILNLKKLNKFIDPPHFKMENIKNAIRLLEKDNYMASIDIKDSYFLIPIAKDHRKFLRFRFEGVLYEFECLPFGLSVAPYVFTKSLKPVMEFLRSKGFISVIYLDDFLLIARTKKECIQNLKITKKLLIRLGFILNTKKCQLIPSKQCTFLGFVLDSKDYSIYLTQEKRVKIFNLTKNLCKLESSKIRDVAKLIGTLISACPGVKYGWLYTKQLEREKFLALKISNDNYDAKMKITHRMKKDLHWWIKNVAHVKNSIRDNVYKCEIFTDASLTGWGAVCKNERLNGWWGVEDLDEHINVLELRAAFFGLKCFAKHLNSCEILLRVDNTTAMANLNKMGGIQSEKLAILSKEIWKWCEDRDIWIFSSYINTKENTIADKESRIAFKETEWEISPRAFTEIVQEFGIFDIDLFASRANTKCDNYISWKKDPDSIAVDAFTVPWNKYYFYAFPPFSVILRVLQKIRVDRAEGVVVVPWWPTQPWFPIFMQLKTSQLKKFEPATDLLISSFREHHPLSSSLSLVAAKLSGKRT